MFIQFIRGFFLFMLLTTYSSAIHPSKATTPTLDSNYFITHQITTLSPDGTSCTLDDGSTWKFQWIDKDYWKQGDYISLVPFMEGNGGNLTAVMFVLYTIPATANLQTGSTSLTITSFTASTGAVTLSDGSQWVLDPYYQKYYTTYWQVGDPITLAGRANEYYLINGNSRNYGMSMTYSLASKGTSQKLKKQ